MVNKPLKTYATIRHNKAQIRGHTLNILGIFLFLKTSALSPEEKTETTGATKTGSTGLLT